MDKKTIKIEGVYHKKSKDWYSVMVMTDDGPIGLLVLPTELGFPEEILITMTEGKLE
jgi:hypothetical protein